MRRILTCLVALAMVSGIFEVGYAAGQQPVTVVVDGETVVFPDGQPYEAGGRVMVPVRFVSEKLGAEVSWFEDTRTVTVIDEHNAIALTVGKQEVIANNETVTLDAAPELKEDRNYVPLRFVSEALGASVDWDNETRTVQIKKGNAPVQTESDKKIYALYHGFRRTREHDGDFGTWKQYYTSDKSKTGLEYINYNPDLIDEEGIHDLASVNKGPIVGMQSEIDEDYVEYKMLLAKIANIDGFMVDFGFPEYGNTILMKAFMEQAQKYDMEVGADWCDGWLVDYDWIKGYRPEIKTREDKLEYFKTSVQFLMDEVYNTPSGAMIDNHPVIFLFGGGPTAAEMKEIINAEYNYPGEMKEPYYIRRTGLPGTYANGNVSFSDPVSVTKDWLNAGVDVHQWIVPRVRPLDDQYPYFDTYASFEDVKNYAQRYKTLWDSGKKVNVNTAVVTPGFDNRGCAAWGAGTYTGFDRQDGEVYRWQWDFYNQNKENIDVMFIASWSDFTEGHEIEPTVVNGYRELETTQEYAAEFKEEEFNETEKAALQIPQRLFETKKYTRKLGEIGFQTTEGIELLEAAALGVSKGAYGFATALIELVEQQNAEYEKDIVKETVRVSVPQQNLAIKVSEKPAVEGSGINGIEVAQGKPVTANDDLSEGRAANAVDGIIADSSRWITSQSKETYTLDIDLQNEFTLIGAELYTGKEDATWGLNTVRLQAYQDGAWVDIPGAAVKGNPEENTDLFWTFDQSVTTSQVRVVCDDGALGVRVREVKIFADPDLTDISLVTPKETVKGKNIVKGKSVKTNDELATGPVSNLIDGVISDDSRWLSSQNQDSYWAEIDLGGEYTIVAGDLYTGKDDGSWALENARLEYWKDGGWVTIPGAETKGNGKTNTDISWIFTEPVTTTKIRFVSDDGSRGVRVRELMVYAEGSADEQAEVVDETFLARRGKEIAQGKSVTASSELEKGKAEKAVDGLVSDSSAWVTPTGKNIYTLDVDLGQKYTIMGSDIYSGKSDGTWAMQHVKLQYWTDNAWKDIPGASAKENAKSNTELRWNFTTPVTTDRVRLVCTDSQWGVRLRELNLYQVKASAETSETPVYDVGSGAYLTVDEEVAKLLRENYFDARLKLEYLGDTDQAFTVSADCDRPLPAKIGTTQGDYSVVAEVRENITYGWEPCEIEMYQENLALSHGLENGADFMIKGTANIRNIEMDFTVYKIKSNSNE